MNEKTVGHAYPEELETTEGKRFRAKAEGRIRSDGMWEGWIAFVNSATGQRLATDVETTQPDEDAFRYWAAGVGPAYLEGALTRALELRTPTPTHGAAIPRRRDRRAATVSAPRAPSPRAILDPFDVQAQGETMLADQLEALDTDHLRDIAREYDLAPPEKAASASREELTQLILDGVRR